MKKYKFDNQKLLSLQDVYIESGFSCPDYYIALSYLASVQIRNILNRTGIDISMYSDHLDEMSHDAATRFLEQYLKHPGYKIEKSIVNRMYKEAQWQLYDPKKRKRELIGDLNLGMATYDKPLLEDPVFDLDTTTLYHLYYSKTFKAAMLAIKQAKKGTKYLYERATQLVYVYKIMHGEQV